MKITGRRLLAPLAAALAFGAMALPGAASATYAGTNGPLVFTSTRDGNANIYRMNADGSGQRALTSDAGSDTDATWSADRSTIAFVSDRDGNSEIYTMGPNGEDQTRLTNDPGSDTDPAFAPDGSIVFASDRDGDREIYRISADGQTTTKLTNNAVQDFAPDVSSSGKIVFQRFTGGVGTGTGDEIFTMNADGTGQTNLTNNASTISDIDPSWAPSGNEITFASNRDGDYEIFRMTSAGVSPTQLTNSSAADTQPVFSPDGLQIAFTSARSGNNDVFTMTRTGASPTNRTANAASDSEPSWTVILDTTITAGPTDGQTVITRTPTFEFASNEAGATFECSVDGSAYAACDTPFATPELADGMHTVAVRSLNAFGDVDTTPASRTFNVDATAPTTTITSGPDDGATISVTNAVYEFSADEASTFECAVDDADFAPCDSPFDTGPLADGTHTFAVRATDAFGNVESPPVTRTFTIDTGNPETTITSGVADGGLTNDSTPTFEFTADDVATFECSVDGSAFASCDTPFTTDPLADGSHTFAVRATDDGGNVDPTPASRTFTVDTTPSDTTIFAGPADGSTIYEDTATFGFQSSDPNDTLECSIDGAAFTPCTSFFVTPRLDDGSHTFAARSVDAAGNPDPTPDTRTFTVDAPPRTTITTGPAEGSSTNNPTPTFEFTSSENDSTFECSVDGSAFAACDTPFTTDSLADGSHTFVVRAVAPDSRADAHPAVRNFVIDTAPPETTITSGPADGDTITSASAQFEFTADQAGSTFECSVDGTAFAACTSPFATNPLADGPHTFEVQATDIAGNTDASPASRSFNVDTTAPETTIDSGPADGSFINNATPSFTFSADDPNATFVCSVDGADFAACTTPFTTESLADGSHTFAVAAVDEFGNTDATPATTSFTVDTANPETTILTGPSGRTSDASPAFTFDSSDADSTFECSVDNGAFAACTSPYSTGVLADGDHSVAVRATDPAGNVDPTPATRSFTVDTVEPETTIDSGPADGSTSGTSAVTFTFSSDDPNATFECDFDSTGFTPCTSPSFYTFEDGAHTFTVQATDQAGNTDSTPATRSFNVDAPPDTTITSGPADMDTIGTDTPTFEFTSSENDSTFECSVDGSAFAACDTPFTTDSLADGDHTFVVRAVDPSNRPDLTPDSRTFTVDTTAPETSIDSGPADGSTINSADPSFSFSSPDASATFECSVDSAGFTPCTSPQGLTGLGEGAHTFEVRASDPTGNTDATPASSSFTVDTIAPETTIDTGPVEGSTQSSRTADFTYSSDDPTSTFECSVDGAAFSSCPDTGTTLTDLTDGLHTFAVRATDAGANTDATPDSRDFTVDGAPDTSITDGPADGSTITTATPSFSFTSEDNAATFECSVDSSAFAPCNTPNQLGPLADGDHTFQVRAVDSASQADQTPASRSFTIDATVPETTIDTGPADGSTLTTSSATFTFSSDDGTASLECSLDGADYDGCTSPVNLTGLGEGTHTFAVRAKDPAGNIDQTPASRTFTVDTVSPDTTITSGPDGPINTATATFTFSSEAGATFQCAIDAEAFAACTSPFTTAALDEGQHVFRVRARDAAMNLDATPASSTFTVDLTAPDTQFTSGPEQGSTQRSGNVAFGFTSPSAGSTFECSLDAGAYAACASPVSVGPLSDGAHSFSVRAVDAAGNRDASPASRSFTVDTSVTPPPPPPNPQAPVIAPRSGTLEVPGSGKVVIATISCPEGGCTVTAPKYVAVRIGGKKYRVRLAAQKRIGAGKSATVKVILNKAARQALIRAGSGRLLVVRLKVASTNGTQASRGSGYDLKKGTKG